MKLYVVRLFIAEGTLPLIYDFAQDLKDREIDEVKIMFSKQRTRLFDFDVTPKEKREPAGPIILNFARGIHTALIRSAPKTARRFIIDRVAIAREFSELVEMGEAAFGGPPVSRPAGVVNPTRHLN